MMTILAVDDNLDDLTLLEHALARSELPLRLFSASDGQEAEDYLRRVMGRKLGEHHPLPDVICLDLHMPRTNGLELLEWLKKEPTLRDIPVVMISASDNPADVNKAYELGAAAYFAKPVRHDVLDDLLRLIAGLALQSN